MKLKFAFLFLFSVLFLSVYSFAQKPVLKWSEEEDEKTSFTPNVLGFNDNYYFVKENNSKILRFKVYDYNGKLISSTDINKTYNGDKLGLVNSLNFHDKYVIILGRADKSKNIFSYYYLVIKDGKINGEIKELCSLTHTHKSFGFVDSFNQDYEGVRLSRDENSVIIVRSSYNKESSGLNEKFIVLRINEQFEIEYQKDIELDHIDDDFIVEDVEFNFSGKPIILGKKKKAKEEFKAEKKENKAKKMEKGSKEKVTRSDFYIYAEKNGTFVGKKIELEEKSILRKSVLYPLSDGKMIMTGFYTEADSEYWGFHGTYFMKLDSDATIIKKSINKFSDEIL